MFGACLRYIYFCALITIIQIQGIVFNHKYNVTYTSLYNPSVCGNEIVQSISNFLLKKKYRVEFVDLNKLYLYIFLNVPS
jgi:hypothetical protein